MDEILSRCSPTGQLYAYEFSRLSRNLERREKFREGTFSEIQFFDYNREPRANLRKRTSDSDSAAPVCPEIGVRIPVTDWLLACVMELSITITMDIQWGLNCTEDKNFCGETRPEMHWVGSLGYINGSKGPWTTPIGMKSHVRVDGSWVHQPVECHPFTCFQVF